MYRSLFRLCVLLIVLSLVVFSSAGRSAAESNEDYALKISLENQLEKKLKQVIVEITGTDRVVIFVNAELVSKGGAGDRGRIEKRGDALVLPGVPAKKEFGAQQSSEIMLPGAAGKFSVNKITLSIWIDKSVPSSIVELIQDIAKNVIGFSQTRGDQIDIKRVDFEGKGFFSTLFAFPNILWLILTLVGGFMMVTIGMFFMAPLKKVIPAVKEIDWSQIRGTGGGTTTVEHTTTFEREVLADRSEKPAAAVPGQQEAALPFAVVKERDLPGLAYLLKDRPAQDAAIVANYLDPALAMRFLDLFPRDRQVEIALILSKEDISMDKVQALEDLVKSKLAYVVGGENKLLSLLDMTNEEVRDKVVKTLETKDAQTAARLKQRIKSLETILREVPALGIQTIFRNIDATLFAQVLKTLPDEIQQKVLTSLSAGAAERLKEEMTLSRPLSSARLKREKQNMMVTLRRLLSEGIIEMENN